MTDVFISQDTSSRSIGAVGVIAALRQEQVRRGDFNIVLTGSRGAFFLEPMVEVQTAHGRVAYGNVSAREVPPLLERGLLEGAPVAPYYLGPVEDLPFLRGQKRITFRNCGVIESGSLHAYLAADGGKALRRALFDIEPQQIIDEVKGSGLRGLGGAAFPTGLKWQTVANCPTGARYVVANADEGDPGTYSDRMLMEGDPFALLEGMTICARAVGAHRGFIYLRSEYPRAYETLRTAIDAARAAGYLGPDILGSGFGFDVEIRRGSGAYVCGEETALLESLEGKRGMVRPKPPYPATQGYFGKPTVVNNVATLCTIPPIVANGGEWYAATGYGRSRGTIALQLAGALRTPGLVEVPFGVTLREVLDTFGGGLLDGHSLLAVQVGGPLGDLITEDGLDLPIDFDAFAQAGAMLGHGGIVVYDDRTDPLDLAHRLMEFCAEESCGKCAPCRIGSRRAAEILALWRDGERRPGDLELLEDIAFAMRNASLCALGSAAPAPVMTAVRLYANATGARAAT